MLHSYNVDAFMGGILKLLLFFHLPGALRKWYNCNFLKPVSQWARTLRNSVFSATFLHIKAIVSFCSLIALFVGVFAKLRKATISFIMFVHLSVYPSACPHGTTRLSLNIFWLNLISETVSKICRKIQCYENPTRITGTLHEDVFTFMTMSC